MPLRAFILAIATFGLAACVGNEPIGLNAERDIFSSPYADNAGTTLDELTYPGSGRWAYDRHGNRVSLSKREASLLRERFEAVEQQIEALEMGTTMPHPAPQSSAPPVAVEPIPDAPVRGGGSLLR